MTANDPAQRFEGRSPAFALLICLFCAAVPVFWTSAAFADARQEAEQHFARGITLAEEASFDAAVVEFKRAYEISPHYAVLYNLSQAYIALAKPVEAVDALERYLRDGAGRMPPALRQKAEADLERQRGRIAGIRLALTPVGATVRIDGALLGPTELSGSLRLAVGSHEVEVSSANYETQKLTVSLAGGDSKIVTVTLLKKSGRLEVHCSTPGLEVSVDGQKVGTTPVVEPLQLPIGPHAVVFMGKTGEATSAVRVDVRDGTISAVACPVGASSTRGALRIRAEPSDARILVDGKPFVDGALASGIHHVEVRRPGYGPWAQKIEVSPGRTELLQMTLRADAQTASGVPAQLVLAYALGIAGLAAGGVGIGVYVDNGARLDEYNAEKARLKRAFDQTPPSDKDTVADLRAEEAVHTKEGHSIDSQEIVAGTLMVGGGALLATGAVLWLTGQSSAEPPSIAAGPMRDGAFLQWQARW